MALLAQDLCERGLHSRYLFHPLVSQQHVPQISFRGHHDFFSSSHLEHVKPAGIPTGVAR